LPIDCTASEDTGGAWLDVAVFAEGLAQQVRLNGGYVRNALVSSYATAGEASEGRSGHPGVRIDDAANRAARWSAGKIAVVMRIAES
jgi:hypothetical protein